MAITLYPKSRRLNGFPIEMIGVSGGVQMPAMPDDALWQSEVSKLLQKFLSYLSTRQREVIVLRYGLNGEGEHTANEIAHLLGVSPQCVHLTHKNAIKKIRHISDSRRLKTALTGIEPGMTKREERNKRNDAMVIAALREYNKQKQEQEQITVPSEQGPLPREEAWCIQRSQPNNYRPMLRDCPMGMRSADRYPGHSKYGQIYGNWRWVTCPHCLQDVVVAEDEHRLFPPHKYTCYSVSQQPNFTEGVIYG